MAAKPTGTGPATETSATEPAPLAPPAASPRSSPGAAPDRLLERLESWYIKQVAHTLERVRCDQWGRRLGLAAVILTTIVGTSTFAALGESPSLGARVAVALLGVLAAVATAVKEYAQYEKRSAANLTAAARYGELRYRAQRLVDQRAAGTAARAIEERKLAGLEDRSARQDAESPAIPNSTYTRAKTWVQTRTRERGDPGDRGSTLKP
jgi:hypothetical protein